MQSINLDYVLSNPPARKKFCCDVKELIQKNNGQIELVHFRMKFRKKYHKDIAYSGKLRLIFENDLKHDFCVDASAPPRIFISIRPSFQMIKSRTNPPMLLTRAAQEICNKTIDILERCNSPITIKKLQALYAQKYSKELPQEDQLKSLLQENIGNKIEFKYGSNELYLFCRDNDTGVEGMDDEKRLKDCRAKLGNLISSEGGLVELHTLSILYQKKFMKPLEAPLSAVLQCPQFQVFPNSGVRFVSLTDQSQLRRPHSHYRLAPSVLQDQHQQETPEKMAAAANRLRTALEGGTMALHSQQLRAPSPPPPQRLYPIPGDGAASQEMGSGGDSPTNTSFDFGIDLWRGQPPQETTSGVIGKMNFAKALRRTLSQSDAIPSPPPREPLGRDRTLQSLFSDGYAPMPNPTGHHDLENDEEESESTPTDLCMKKNVPWWTEDLTQLRKEYNKARRVRNKSHEHRQSYTEAKRLYQKQSRGARLKWEKMALNGPSSQTKEESSHRAKVGESITSDQAQREVEALLVRVRKLIEENGGPVLSTVVEAECAAVGRLLEDLGAHEGFVEAWQDRFAHELQVVILPNSDEPHITTRKQSAHRAAPKESATRDHKQQRRLSSREIVGDDHGTDASESESDIEVLSDYSDEPLSSYSDESLSPDSDSSLSADTPRESDGDASLDSFEENIDPAIKHSHISIMGTPRKHIFVDKPENGILTCMNCFQLPAPQKENTVVKSQRSALSCSKSQFQSPINGKEASQDALSNRDKKVRALINDWTQMKEKANALFELATQAVKEHSESKALGEGLDESDFETFLENLNQILGINCCIKSELEKYNVEISSVEVEETAAKLHRVKELVTYVLKSSSVGLHKPTTSTGESDAQEKVEIRTVPSEPLSEVLPHVDETSEQHSHLQKPVTEENSASNIADSANESKKSEGAEVPEFSQGGSTQTADEDLKVAAESLGSKQDELCQNGSLIALESHVANETTKGPFSDPDDCETEPMAEPPIHREICPKKILTKAIEGDPLEKKEESNTALASGNDEGDQADSITVLSPHGRPPRTPGSRRDRAQKRAENKVASQIQKDSDPNRMAELESTSPGGLIQDEEPLMPDVNEEGMSDQEPMGGAKEAAVQEEGEGLGEDSAAVALNLKVVVTLAGGRVPWKDLASAYQRQFKQPLDTGPSLEASVRRLKWSFALIEVDKNPTAGTEEPGPATELVLCERFTYVASLRQRLEELFSDHNGAVPLDELESLYRSKFKETLWSPINLPMFMTQGQLKNYCHIVKNPLTSILDQEEQDQDPVNPTTQSVVIENSPEGWEGKIYVLNRKLTNGEIDAALSLLISKALKEMNGPELARARTEYRSHLLNNLRPIIRKAGKKGVPCVKLPTVYKEHTNEMLHQDFAGGKLKLTVMTYFQEDFAVVGKHPHFSIVCKDLLSSTKDGEDKTCAPPNEGSAQSGSVSDEDDNGSVSSTSLMSGKVNDLESTLYAVNVTVKPSTSLDSLQELTTTPFTSTLTKDRRRSIGPGLYSEASSGLVSLMSSINSPSKSGTASPAFSDSGHFRMQDRKGFLHCLAERFNQILVGRKDAVTGMENVMDLGQLPVAYQHRFGEKLKYPGKLKQLFTESPLRERFCVIKINHNKGQHLYVGFKEQGFSCVKEPETLPDHVITNLRYLLKLQAPANRKMEALHLLKTYHKLFGEDLYSTHPGSLQDYLELRLPDDFEITVHDATTFVTLKDQGLPLPSSPKQSHQDLQEAAKAGKGGYISGSTSPPLPSSGGASTGTKPPPPPSSLLGMSPKAAPFVLQQGIAPNPGWQLTVVDHPSQLPGAESVLVPMALNAGIVGFDAEGVRLGSDGQLTLVQFAVRDVQLGSNGMVHVFLVDVVGLHQAGFLGGLGKCFVGALLQDPAVVKLCHDCHNDTAALAAQHGLHAQGIYDTQVASELLTGVVFGSFNELLKRMQSQFHRTKNEYKHLMRQDQDCWARRPLPDHLVQYAADDARLLLEAGEKLQDMMHAHRGQIMQASAWRAQHAALTGGDRRVVYNRVARNALMSYELWCTTKIGAAKSTSDLQSVQVSCEIDAAAQLLPMDLRSELLKMSTPKMQNLALDLDKKPVIMTADSRRKIQLRNRGEPGGLVSRELLISIVTKAGGMKAFGPQRALPAEEAGPTGEAVATAYGHNRCVTLEKRLERVALMRNCQGKVYGMTITPGRHVRGCAELIDDLLLPNHASVLVLGLARSGKTTVLRELARRLASSPKENGAGESVCVVDTHSEICGDSDLPHPASGDVRRLMVPSLAVQGSILEETVRNHRPDCVVVDELFSSADVEAVLKLHARGVRVVCGALASLPDLVRDPEKSGLVGVKVVLPQPNQSSSMAMDGGAILNKVAWPVFDVIVELTAEKHNEWTVITKVSQAVDNILSGAPYGVQVRRREMKTDYVSLTFQQRDCAPGISHM